MAFQFTEKRIGLSNNKPTRQNANLEEHNFNNVRLRKLANHFKHSKKISALYIENGEVLLYGADNVS